ncbi:MAG: hypothetical protein JJ693_04055 [Acidithiobacillus sp.]|nr:hypothetical protein [Acidithiobacillus sp.]
MVFRVAIVCTEPFPLQHSLADVDFTESPVNESSIEHLVKGYSLNAAHNILLVGARAPGKLFLP